jgi:RimJ/RimL family protein N-acetyltransferase
MDWRNEQMYHLRQNAPLTKELQDKYFDSVVEKLFDQINPSQILFTLLEDDLCIGYGGLVHINWIDKNAEISFIMNTELEGGRFTELWSVFLSLIETVAFKELKMHKVYVYAFDLRPHLYITLLRNNFFLDATLRGHCLYENSFIDVVIYSKINKD